MIVCKFGGTSVQDAPAIRRLVGTIRDRVAEHPLLVVSALAGITDGLLGLARLAEMGGSGFRDRLGELLARHEGTARELPGAEAAMAFVRADADGLARELEGLGGRRASPRELDAITGRGELWSSRLITSALCGAEVPAEWVDVRTIMVTDDRFGRATPYTQVLSVRARERLIPMLERAVVPLMGLARIRRPETWKKRSGELLRMVRAGAFRKARKGAWDNP